MGGMGGMGGMMRGMMGGKEGGMGGMGNYAAMMRSMGGGMGGGRGMGMEMMRGMMGGMGPMGMAGRDAETLGREQGTPLYAFDLLKIGEQARSLQDAFAAIEQPFRLRYALKCNREPEVLTVLRGLGPAGDDHAIGMDVCSPGEVLHALEHGWSAEEISSTGTNVSERDLDVILEHGVHINLDLVTQMSPLRACMKGTEMGGGRCISLRGELGQPGIHCAIYENRPTPCREFDIWMPDGSPNPDCQRLRLGLGLPAVPPRPDAENDPQGPMHPDQPAAA